MKLNQAASVKISENIFLYDLSRMRGVTTLLDRIPDNTSGVYAWYRNFKISDKLQSDPEFFVDFVLREVYKPNFEPRRGKIPPYMRICLESSTSFAKKSLLLEASKDPEFRNTLVHILEASFLFQQPLYIGKARDIKSRVKNHLSEASPLKDRLSDSNHDLEQCKLLMIFFKSDHEFTLSNKNALDTFVSGREHGYLIDDLEDANIDNEESLVDRERLIEDILSRIFLPSFSVRYG